MKFSADRIIWKQLWSIPFKKKEFQFKLFKLFSFSCSKSPTRPLSSNNSKIPNNNLNSTIRRENRSKLSRRQVEITKNLFYVVCAFFICLTPYSVCLVYDASDPAVPYTGAFVLFNSCINPIIYATKHPYFKQVFKCILQCKFQDVPEPASFVRSLRSSKEVNCCGNTSCL